MFYNLPQGCPLYQKIDTLFRRITWRHAVHSQLQGPVTDFGLQCISSCWHALPYKWLPRRGVSLNKMSHTAVGFCPPCLPPISSPHPHYWGQPRRLGFVASKPQNFSTGVSTGDVIRTILKIAVLWCSKF